MGPRGNSSIKRAGRFGDDDPKSLGSRYQNTSLYWFQNRALAETHTWKCLNQLKRRSLCRNRKWIAHLLPVLHWPLSLGPLSFHNPSVHEVHFSFANDTRPSYSLAAFFPMHMICIFHASEPQPWPLPVHEQNPTPRSFRFSSLYPLLWQEREVQRVGYVQRPNQETKQSVISYWLALHQIPTLTKGCP